MPEIIDKIKKLMENETAGNPMSGLKWTKKTTQKIADELNCIGIKVSKNTVGTLLKEMDYSLRANSKKNSNGEKKLSAKEKKIETNNSFI
jgi:transposase